MIKDTSTSKTIPIRFAAIFFLIFFFTSVVLFTIDFVPEKPSNKNNAPQSTNQNATAEEVARSESPTRIVIKNAGVDTTIQNPVSTNLGVLDNALLSGAVRYPGSSNLGENATMFLFGHQSYLPVVKNQAFKAFNGIQKLSEGDVIQVYSDTAVYEYAVKSVSLVDASNALIPLVSNKKSLVLSTCNSFGDPGERYVIKADYLSRTEIN